MSDRGGQADTAPLRFAYSVTGLRVYDLEQSLAVVDRSEANVGELNTLKPPPIVPLTILFPPLKFHKTKHSCF